MGYNLDCSFVCRVDFKAGLTTNDCLFFVVFGLAGNGYDTLNIETEVSFDSSYPSILIADELETGFKHRAFIC